MLKKQQLMGHNSTIFMDLRLYTLVFTNWHQTVPK